MPIDSPDFGHVTPATLAPHTMLMQCKCNRSTPMQWRALIMHCEGDDGR